VSHKLKTLLSEDTPITIGLLVIIIGGVLWLSSMDASGKANTKALDEIKMEQKLYLETVLSIDRRLANLEGRLK